jgi:hypothetical protein
VTSLISANVGKEVLTANTAFSDRFVYSNYFVPLLVSFEQTEIPLLPFYTKKQVLQLALAGVYSEEKLRASLEELGMAELWDKNDMDTALDRLRGQASVERDRLDREVKAVARNNKAVKKIALREPEPPRLAVLEASDEEPTRPTVLEEQETELIAGLLQSTVGFVFLDRTRIRPAGFGIGEHVYALGLAPAEEVLLEQKTFAKKQSTFEEQTEQEKQFDIEFSSTYTTELQEGLERQRSLTDSWGLGISQSTNYQSPMTPYGQVNAGYTVNYTKNVTQASQESSRRSVKDGQTTSSKVSGRYRAQHKTTFKVSKEEGFETTSKRTIHNPNRVTPITLHYFKVLQRLELTQERYGARLCWAPAVSNPARNFIDKIQAGRTRMLDEAMAKLPQPPVEPPAPSADGSSSTTRQTQTFPSDWVEANKWGATGDMSAEYDVDVTIPDGWSWDGTTANITIELDTKRTSVSRWVVGTPLMVDGKLRVRIHIGTGSWLFGPGINFQIKITCFKDVTVTGQAGEDAAYLAALEDWRTRMKEWTELHDQTLQEANEAADAFEQQMRRELSPVNEMISQIVEEEFDKAVRDDIWEVEYWQRLFDWERASFVTYPSWWSTDPAPDPTLDPSDYINASWAKLYLPVRAGMELAALRWIFGKSVAKPMDATSEKAFAGVIADLEKFRKDNLGSADEQPNLKTACQEVADAFVCMAKWYELMPTDGTHCEVVQSTTTAADVDTRRELDDAAELRKALNESQKRSATIKDKAIDKITSAAKLDVRVSADGASGDWTPSE